MRAGVPGIRVHDLRHAAATLAFEAGASVKDVQAMLRHTRQATTADVYTHRGDGAPGHRLEDGRRAEAGHERVLTAP